MSDLTETLTRTAAEHPDRPALRSGEHTIRYTELEDLTARAAALMASMGVEPGDRVGLMLPNVLEFPVLFYGALRLGAVVVPMNPLLKSREIAHYATDSGMTLLWAHASVPEQETAAASCRVEHVDHALLAALSDHIRAQAVSRSGTDTAVIVYTSGTTGAPKGAELTHDNLHGNARLLVDDLLALTPRDVIMGVLPLFHIFGLSCVLTTAVTAGALVTLVPRFEPAVVLETIARDEVTVFAGVPTMYTALARMPEADPDRTATLRTCISGGASLPTDVLRSFEQRFGNTIFEGYGLSETSSVAGFNLMGSARPGSIGTPIRGVEFRIVDEQRCPVAPGTVGELCVRGHNVMKGYWNRPDATAEAFDSDDWFHTGDLARRDDDGYYYIVDRKKDLIIRGGFNVYPREIEEVLYEHPAVHEAAVLALPHPTHGEEVGAAVALRPGHDASADELRDYVKARVAPYKYPRHVWFLDTLPKSASGKVLKRSIAVPDPSHEKGTAISDSSTSTGSRLSRVETESGAELAVLTIDNPPLNLFGKALMESIAADIADLAAAPPRAVLLRAAGEVVSGGVDVRVFDGLSAEQGIELWRDLFERIIHPLESLPCPVIFAAHGLTLTAAFEIALACDIILAAPKAKFGLVETVVGLTPSMGGPQRLAERAGSGRARELVMTADLYDAKTLADWGVVNAVHDDVQTAARELAARLADGPTRAHAATKQIVAAWRSSGVAQADSVTPQVSGELFTTEDLQGAVASFLQVGPGNASYTGR